MKILNLLALHACWILLGVALQCLIVNPANAQNDYLEGYIVTTENGDTLHGFIREAITETSHDIFFRPSKNALSDQLYSISQVKNYYIASLELLYEAHQIEYNGVQIDAYLKYLIQGEISLFAFLDETMKQHFFIKNQEGQLRELRYEEKDIYSEDEMEIHRRKSKFYIGEFKIAFAECPALAKEVDDYSFGEKSFRKGVIKYHKCQGKSYVEYGIKKEPASVEFGLRGGGNRLFLNSDQKRLNLPGFGYSYGAYINTYLPNTKKRFSIEVGYTYHNISVKERFTDQLIPLEVRSIPIIVNKYFPGEKQQFSLRAGFAFDPWIPEQFGDIQLGMGYKFFLKNLKLVTFLDYRRTFGKTLILNVGLAF